MCDQLQHEVYKCFDQGLQQNTNCHHCYVTIEQNIYTMHLTHYSVSFFSKTFLCSSHSVSIWIKAQYTTFVDVHNMHVWISSYNHMCVHRHRHTHRRTHTHTCTHTWIDRNVVESEEHIMRPYLAKGYETSLAKYITVLWLG